MTLLKLDISDAGVSAYEGRARHQSSSSSPRSPSDDPDIISLSDLPSSRNAYSKLDEDVKEMDSTDVFVQHFETELRLFQTDLQVSTSPHHHHDTFRAHFVLLVPPLVSSPLLPCPVLSCPLHSSIVYSLFVLKFCALVLFVMVLCCGCGVRCCVCAS